MNEDRPMPKRDPEEKKASWEAPVLSSMPMREALSQIGPSGITDGGIYS
jgi:hypothetical protein